MYKRQDVKKLYELIEVNYNADTIKSELSTLLPQLQSKPYFSQYAEQLRDVIVRKLFVSASTKYENVKIEELFQLVSLPAPFDQSYWDIERALLQAAVEDYVSFSIDHVSDSVTFVKDPMAVFTVAEPVAVEEDEEAEEEATGEEQEQEDEEVKEVVNEDEGAEPEPIVTRNRYIRNRLSELSKLLHEVDTFNEGSYMEKVKLARENLIQQTKETIDNAKRIADERAQKYKEQKQKYMENAAVNAEEDAELRNQRILEEKAALDAKLEEDAQRRLIAKKKRELEALKEAEKKKFIDEANEKGHITIDSNEVKDLELADLKKVVVNLLSKDKNDLDARMNFALKKLDHTERALRKTELPLLQKEADTLKEADLVKYEAMKAKIVNAAKAEHDAKMEDHERLANVYSDYKSLRDRLLSAHDSEMADIRKEKKEALKAAKKARIEEVRKQRYEEAVAKQKEDVERAEREKRAAAQDEIMRKQREVEAALEKKDAKTAITPAAPVAGGSKPMTFAEKMRAKKAAAAAAGNAPSPVSYTHLDVYKRQILGKVQLS